MNWQSREVERGRTACCSQIQTWRLHPNILHCPVVNWISRINVVTHLFVVHGVFLIHALSFVIARTCWGFPEYGSRPDRSSSLSLRRHARDTNGENSAYSSPQYRRPVESNVWLSTLMTHGNSGMSLTHMSFLAGSHGTTLLLKHRCGSLAVHRHATPVDINVFEHFRWRQQCELHSWSSRVLCFEVLVEYPYLARNTMLSICTAHRGWAASGVLPPENDT
jgi:hypothetical protein